MKAGIIPIPRVSFAVVIRIVVGGLALSWSFTVGTRSCIRCCDTGQSQQNTARYCNEGLHIDSPPGDARQSERPRVLVFVRARHLRIGLKNRALKTIKARLNTALSRRIRCTRIRERNESRNYPGHAPDRSRWARFELELAVWHSILHPKMLGTLPQATCLLTTSRTSWKD